MAKTKPEEVNADAASLTTTSVTQTIKLIASEIKGEFNSASFHKAVSKWIKLDGYIKELFKLLAGAEGLTETVITEYIERLRRRLRACKYRPLTQAQYLRWARHVSTTYTASDTTNTKPKIQTIAMCPLLWPKPRTSHVSTG